jgi:hypothetical protein
MGKGQVGPPREVYYPRFPYPEKETAGDRWEADRWTLTPEQETKYCITGICIIAGALFLLALAVLCATGVIPHPTVRP